jgi:hypothetical protein
MANLSYTNTPLIAHLYDTADAAMAAAADLGCTGYRTYNINGENKYVPCSSFLAYEQSLRYYKSQGVQNQISGFGNIGDKAVGLQFANSKDEIAGDPFFTLGNFSLSTSVTRKSVPGKEVATVGGDKAYTAESINKLNPAKNTTQSAVDQVNKKIEDNLTVRVLFNKKKLQNYVLYAPMKETIKNTIIEITQKYPAGIKLNVIGLASPTVSEYNYSTNKDTAQFKINLSNIFNPFGIEYTATGTTINDDANITPLRNFSKTYTDFVVYHNQVEYKILNATLPSSYNDNDTGIYVTVEGNPFAGYVNANQTVNRTFWLKPKMQKFDDFQSNLSDMGQFLLDYDYDKKKYVSVIRYKKFTDLGVELNANETLLFPMYDEVNIDLFSDAFDKYITKLNTISDDFDATKTNLISRFLTTDSLKEFDTDDRRINLMFGLIGKNFDTIKKYVDGITFMTNLSYDKIENIPDLLVKNYGNMLGFETYNVEDENTLIESLFDIKDLRIEPGYKPVDIDIELWRRIFINSYYLWKSKGTRKSIEFILNLVGLPDSIFEVNEYVYVARNKVDFVTKSYAIYGSNYNDNTLLSLVPFDLDGYPTVPPRVKYQEAGFNIANDGRNFGPYDFGTSYIKAYEKQGSEPIFSMDRFADNVKSWVYSESQVLRLSEDTIGYTEYYEDDSRLVVNSKELEVYISSDKIFDFTLYRYLNRNSIELNPDLNFRVVPEINAGTLTFNQFLQKSMDNYIKPDNRKTIKTYPSLSKIYYDYLALTGNPVTNTKSLEFLNKFDSSWVKLVQQFTPATTILNAGKKIQNSKFLDNKFVYKHGLNNKVNWLGTDGSEFQDLAKRPVNQGTTNPFNTVGFKKDPFTGESSTFTLVGNKGKNYVGYDPTINEYFGFYYSIEDACNSIEIYRWDEDENYGDDSIYGGNVNTGSGDRKGVYVVYENNLYRLNTNGMYGFGSTYTISTDPTPYVAPNNLGLIYGANNTLTIPLPNGPGKYLLEFTVNGDDDLELYDGTTSGTLLDSIGASTGTTTYSEILTFTTDTLTILNLFNETNDVIITNFSVGLLSNKPNAFDVYELIPLTADASTITFKDDIASVMVMSERNYYIEAVSLGHAYLAANIDYICPVPKPHTCYYNYSGLTINMGTVATNYYDETNQALTIEQSKYYGYSKNTATTEPDDAVYGIPGNWVIPYRKPLPWNNGVVYYAGDVVTKSSVNYLVTGATLTGYTVSGAPTGTTTTTIVPGLYQAYLDRTKTDPYMHIDAAYIKRLRVNPFSDIVSINLSKNLYLYQVYSGSTPTETYKVTDNVLNDELYISETSTVTFDGFYSLDETKVGPFYTPLTDEIITNTLIEELELEPDKDNYIDIKSLNENFNVSNNNVSLSDGYYLIKQNAFLKFEADLYFESELTLEQTVTIKLLDQFGTVYHDQSFSFSGSNPGQDRVTGISFQGIFPVDTRLYLAVNPETYGCTLKRYEEFEYDYVNPTSYSTINDPRFRVYFNGGRSLINGHYTDDVLSIEPIGDDANFQVEHNLFKTDNILDTYKFRPKPSISLSYDESNIFGLMYGKFYEKFKTNSLIGDVSVYEKGFNNDKIDFELTVRSKDVAALLPEDQSQNGVKKSYTITSTNNYLGNTPQEAENMGVTKNIIIGKEPKFRQKTLNKENFPFLRYLKNETVNSSYGTSIDFIGYDAGFSDYDLVNYNGDIVDNLISKTRYKNATGYWKKENAVYSTQLYQDILAVVPYFTPTINNYQINDIVKVKITDYDVVVETPTGTTIETKTVERLYVCIEDITSNHLRKKNLISYSMNIHPIYQPNGARAAFIPIEKYDLKSFTPIGYDKFDRYSSVKTNIRPYRYDAPIILTASPTQKLNLGDIIKVTGTGTTYSYYEYVYNKSVTFESGNVYPTGSFVYYNGSSYTVGNPVFSYWMKLTPTGTTTPATGVDWHEFQIDTPSVSYIGDNSIFYKTSDVVPIAFAPGADFVSFTPTAYRFRNLIPTVSGSTGFEIEAKIPLNASDVIADMTPNYLPTGSTAGQLDGSDMIAYYLYTGFTSTGVTYAGTANSIYTGYTLETNLIQNDYSAVDNRTLPGFSITKINIDSNVKPLFERLCSNTDDGSINDFANTSYSVTNLNNNKKYAVSRNVLYRATSSFSPTLLVPLIEPHLSIAASQNRWEEYDFMLVSKFKHYKDRTKVKIYEGTVESLNSTTKNSLYFFNKDLTLKSGFAENSFSGTTKNNKLLTGVNKLFDAKNENIRDVEQYGVAGFRKSGSDIIMDYYYERDDNNLPLTGEFIGGLTVTNPCGHHAKVIFGVLFDADLTLLTQLYPRKQTDFALPVLSSATYNPNVRVIVNQFGATKMTVKISGPNMTTITKVLTKNQSIDDIVPVVKGDTITIDVTYDTNKNLTKYKSGNVDGYTLYNASDVGIDNTFITATKTSVSKILTRTIKLKDLYEDRVVKLDFEGANFIELGTVDPLDYIKL